MSDGVAQHRAEDPAGDEGNWAHRRWDRWRTKRRRKKARIAAMPLGKRVLRRSMIFSTWILGLIATLMVVAIVLFYTLTDVPRPESLPLPQVATIEYSDGSTLAKIGTVDRTIVNLSQVPSNTRWAVLAAEDRSFYSESAVSIKGTARAALTDLTGGNTQGGSGITQQYVKNAYLSSSQTLTRKLKELMIAIKLTREYSKNQILEFYLNTVYFGRNTYGIDAAAEAFFGIPVEKLDVAQSALLAALLRAPGYYDPAVNLSAAKLRWRYVLDGMVKTGHLTKAQEDSLTFPKTKPITGNGIGVTGWKYLIKQEVMAELASHGISADEVAQQGLTIRTTINPKAQAAAVSAVTTEFKHLTSKQRNLKHALVAIDPSTGGVLAYYGGTGADVPGPDGQVDYNDYASQGTRPPGSSFKPYVLATALTQTLQQTFGQPHYAINSKIDGSYCLTIEGTKICNDPGDKPVSSSQVTIADAMKYSLNTTFDLLSSEVGPDNVADTAHAMGIASTNAQGAKTLQDSDGTTDFGIGIGDYPVSVLDQASGYATIADGGVKNSPYLVQSATASDGDVVYKHTGNAKQVIDKRVANDVAVTMRPIAAYSGDGLDGGRQSAAKTGTEGLSTTTTNNSDAWMVGFTPQVSAAVWVGTGYSKPIYNSNGTPMYGSQMPGQTWKLFMDTYLKGQPDEPLPSKQQIATDGGTPIATPTATPTPTHSSSSSSPKPTFSITSGFPSSPTPTPSTSAASSSTPTPSASPTPSDTATCGGLLQPPCTP